MTVAGATRQLHGQIRGPVAEITQRLWGDLPAEDLATAGRALAIINERANTELGRRTPRRADTSQPGGDS